MFRSYCNSPIELDASPIIALGPRPRTTGTYLSQDSSAAVRVGTTSSKAVVSMVTKANVGTNIGGIFTPPTAKMSKTFSSGIQSSSPPELTFISLRHPKPPLLPEISVPVVYCLLLAASNYFPRSPASFLV